MYLPRSLISHLYQNLTRTHHSLSPPVLILVALEPDALCACRILTALLKRDYIAHKIQPISGYGDLSLAGQNLVQPMKVENGGSGGLVICLGVGGLVDLQITLGLQGPEDSDDSNGCVEVWLIDARRPWNLGNVFGGNSNDAVLLEDAGRDRRIMEAGVTNGRIEPSYKPGQGGIIVYDDGDIEQDLAKEREAYCQLLQMPEIEDDGADSDSSGSENDDVGVELEGRPSKKRKSMSDQEGINDASEGGNERPQRRRRSNSVSRKT